MGRPYAGDDHLGFLRGGGEIGALIAELDWAANALGPIRAWPERLKSALTILLPSRTTRPSSAIAPNCASSSRQAQ
jgi:hypothetical protein